MGLAGHSSNCVSYWLNFQSSIRKRHDPIVRDGTRLSFHNNFRILESRPIPSHPINPNDLVPSLIRNFMNSRSPNYEGEKSRSVLLSHINPTFPTNLRTFFSGYSMEYSRKRLSGLVWLRLDPKHVAYVRNCQWEGCCHPNNYKSNEILLEPIFTID